MREIKFRLIKEYSDKRVLAGYERLNTSGYWQWMCPEINPDNGERWTHGVFSIGATYIRNQFTGLKDKNGNEIYEGDVCKIHYYHLSEGSYAIGVVEFMESHTGFSIRGTKDHDGKETSSIYGLNFRSGGAFGDHLAVEVIGNIHQNPELL